MQHRGERLNCAFEIHLAYIMAADHHPQSRSWKSQLPADSLPPFSIRLIPRALCGRKRLNGLRMSKCKNPRDLHCPQIELYCNLGPKIFIAQDVQQKGREKVLHDQWHWFRPIFHYWFNTKSEKEKTECILHRDKARDQESSRAYPPKTQTHQTPGYFLWSSTICVNVDRKDLIFWKNVARKIFTEHFFTIPSHHILS